MKRRVYIETSVVSYLASRASRDVVSAGRQQLTHSWWETRRPVFDLVISEVVLKEVRAGDPGAAGRRMEFVVDLPLLDITDEATELAALLIEQVPLPPPAAVDAAHIAVAAYHGVDFLLTWNLAHIANAALRRRVEEVYRAQRYQVPILCTPDELMENDHE